MKFKVQFQHFQPLYVLLSLRTLRHISLEVCCATLSITAAILELKSVSLLWIRNLIFTERHPALSLLLIKNLIFKDSLPDL